MDSARHVAADRPTRTPAGDVILPPTDARAEPTRSAWPRVAALLLAALATTGVVLIVVGAAERGGAPVAGSATAFPAPSSGSSRDPRSTTAQTQGTDSTDSAESTENTENTQSAGSAEGTAAPDPDPGTAGSAPVPMSPPEGAGGLAAARARVSAFVAALNAGNFDRANRFLCRSQAGRYDQSSLYGIEPGSLGVGGVTVQGRTGRAIVTFQPTGGGRESHSLFGLTIEQDQWMLCRAR